MTITYSQRFFVATHVSSTCALETPKRTPHADPSPPCQATMDLNDENAKKTREQVCHAMQL